MQLSNLDPVSLNHVLQLDDAPFVVEGEGDDTLVIYFESDQNKDQYLKTPYLGFNETLYASAASFGR